MLYAVYFAYAKWEIYDKDMAGYSEMPDYPKELARTRVYDNKADQINAYANTMCPASQLIEAATEGLIVVAIDAMAENFINDAWLDEHIRPFI